MSDTTAEGLTDEAYQTILATVEAAARDAGAVNAIRGAMWAPIFRGVERIVADRLAATQADPRPIVAATIESVLWAIGKGDDPDDNLRDEFAKVANEVRRMERDDACCALCEEVTCDEGCPLEGWRIY